MNRGIRSSGVPAADLTIRPPRLRVTGSRSECAFVIYQLVAGRHRQLGVVVELSIDDYRNGRIRRHEATHPGRVRQLQEQRDAGSAGLVPVTLLHRVRPRLRSLLIEAAAREPDVLRPPDDGTSELAWIERDVDRAQAIHGELAGLEVLYLADGHHRLSAAERSASRRSELGEDAPEAQFVLAALFPADEMRILGYHRCLARPDRMSTSDLIGMLAGLPATERVVECASVAEIEPAPGVVVLHLDGRWYRIGLRTPQGAAGPRASLDIVALEDGVLAPMLGSPGVGSDSPITALPGTSDATTVAHWCAEHRAIGFLLHPPSVEQIMAVADAGQVMPPKSTWFDPKPRAGLFPGVGSSYS